MYIKIKLSTFLEILYFINDWLRLMGFGGEYRKLSSIVRQLREQNCFDSISQHELNKFYYIHKVVREFNKLDKFHGGG